MSGSAAIYLRSSKDRSDVSIHAQRRALQLLATERRLSIVQEFADVVESAKDELRPGFQALLAELKGTGRTWSTLLVVDTSRLSRRRYMAQVFGHECHKRGVEILYSRLPPVDPIADLVVIGVMQVFDELHSVMSREKGLAGMAENVRRGWRAGGRAPRGYRLRSVETGAIREGRPVTKTVLERDPTYADVVRRYLEGRARGRSRAHLKREIGISWPDTSLIGMEWQALTYAGALVWNVHRSRLPEGGYQGGVKRRPRAEWIIQEDAHEALISRTEAETILTSLETSSEKRRRRTPAAYLLSGLLETPGGDPWHGEARGLKRYYHAKGRGHGRTVPANLIEDAVVSRVRHEMRSKAFIRSLTLAARRIYRQQPKTSLAPIRAEIAAIDARILRTLELAEGLTDSAPALRRVDVLEAERNAAVSRLRLAERDTAAARTLAGVTEESIGGLLQDLLLELDEDREHAKEVLRRAIDRIVVDPTERTVQVHYHFATRDKMASPTGFEPVSPP